MRMSASLLVLLVLVTPAPAAEDDPVLLATHAACFVHGLPAWPAASRMVERAEGPGHVLLYTSRASGTMTRLLPATGTVRINTVRVSYVVTRLLGVAADAQRLYVLEWTSGRSFDRPPSDGDAILGGRYRLHVFWLADGAALGAPSLDVSGLPSAAPPPTLGPGPLKLVPGGVSCLGTTALYDGRTSRDR